MPARLYLVFKSPETVYYERVNQPFRFSVHVNLARCILELPTLGFLTNLRGSELFFSQKCVEHYIMHQMAWL